MKSIIYVLCIIVIVILFIINLLNVEKPIEKYTDKSLENEIKKLSFENSFCPGSSFISHDQKILDCKKIKYPRPFGHPDRDIAPSTIQEKSNSFYLDEDEIMKDSNIYLLEDRNNDVNYCNSITTPSSDMCNNSAPIATECKRLVNEYKIDSPNNKESVLNSFESPLNTKIKETKRELDARVKDDPSSTVVRNYPNRKRVDEQIDNHYQQTSRDLTTLKNKLNEVHTKGNAKETERVNQENNYYNDIKQCSRNKLINDETACKEIANNNNKDFSNSPDNMSQLAPAGCVYDKTLNRYFLNQLNSNQTINIAGRGRRYKPICNE